MAEDPITGLVLAGGAARRLQAAHPGADKGLLPLAGRPLIAWAIDNLAPQVQSLVIAPAAVDPEDIEMLQDLISAAFNEATKKVDEMMAQEMGKLTSGLGLPPGLL